MKLIRPYIPLKIRLEVIARQALVDGQLKAVLYAVTAIKKDSERLAYLLQCKFGDERFHLDHHPCLALRYFDDETGQYDPPANSVEHLIYRVAEDHEIKTRIRGDHGQFSDLALIRREKRRMAKQNSEAKQAERSKAQPSNAERGPAKQSEKAVGRKWPAARWPQGRKLRSRGWS